MMIWGCMTTFGPGVWCKIEGRMNGHLYKFILENFLWSTIHNYNLDSSRLVFQHDNDSKHMMIGKNMQEWLASQPIQWPTISGFESHWTLLGTSQMTLEQIYDTSKRYPRIVGVCVCLAYPYFGENDCMELYEIMPWRIDVVLKSRGYWTNY